MSENYRPRSPDFSSAPPQPLPTSYEASPFFAPPSGRVSQQYVPPFDEMARRSSRLQPEDAPVPEDVQVPEAPVAMSDEPPMSDDAPQERLGAGIEVKTKFPVARIKRIMQADEDVGKVAQVTPIAVCKSSGLSGLESVADHLPLCSESIRALYDHASHEGSRGSQGSQFEARHSLSSQTRSRQGRGTGLPGRYYIQGPRSAAGPETRR